MALFGDRSHEALSRRLETLEARCQDLVAQLQTREAELARLRLELTVLSKRLDEQVEQAAKATAALSERVETVWREQGPLAAASSTGASAVSRA